MHLIQTTLEKCDREKVNISLPATTIIMADAKARLYLDYPDNEKWNDSGLSGCLVFAFDTVAETYSFKLVDISDDNNGVMWETEIHRGLQYNRDQTLFHVFKIDKSLAAFCFSDERESQTFGDSVINISLTWSLLVKARDGPNLEHLYPGPYDSCMPYYVPYLDCTASRSKKGTILQDLHLEIPEHLLEHRNPSTKARPTIIRDPRKGLLASIREGKALNEVTLEDGSRLRASLLPKSTTSDHHSIRETLAETLANRMRGTVIDISDSEDDSSDLWG
ncbi:hypothetical protein TWF281_006816 [Arthrobotrys megalospora]